MSAVKVSKIYKCLNEKTQFADIRVITFLEAGRPWGTRSKG